MNEGYQVIERVKEFHYNQGIIDTDYKCLCKLFGEPNKDYPQSDANWNILFHDGTEVSIYNWNPNKQTINLEDINEWSVGGKNKKSLENIKILLLFDFEEIKNELILINQKSFV